MTSPVSQADLKLSLLDRVSRKLTDPEPEPQLHERDLVMSPDQANLHVCRGDSRNSLDRAILQIPQDENDNDRNCQMDECGDMETSTGENAITTDKHYLPVDLPIEPPAEERITVDDFDLPFDDDTKENRVSEVVAIVEKPPDKHEISLENLRLPFDEDPTITNSPAHVTVPSQPKRARRRKKSADFEIIMADVLISPDVQLPDVPTCRRSSRLRRKSTELNRSRIHLYEPEPEDDDDFEPVIELTESSIGVASNAESSSEIDSNALSVETETIDSAPSPGMVQALQHVSMEDAQQQVAMEEEENVAPRENLVDNSMHIDAPKDNKTKGRAKRKCTVPTKENNTPPPKKAKASPKCKPAPCLEDIYMNRLWRTEMPTEKTWETIYEEPKVNAKGKKVCPRPQRRVLDPDEFYTQTKLKRRRNKAIKQGWKPLSKKRLQKAETLLFEKLSIFEQDLETDETNSIASNEVDSNTTITNVGIKEVDTNTTLDNVDLKDLQISKAECAPVENPVTDMEET